MRLAMLPLPIVGLGEPLRANIEADMVDSIIERLMVLRVQMLPVPSLKRAVAEAELAALVTASLKTEAFPTLRIEL